MRSSFRRLRLPCLPPAYSGLAGYCFAEVYLDSLFTIYSVPVLLFSANNLFHWVPIFSTLQTSEPLLPGCVASIPTQPPPAV